MHKILLLLIFSALFCSIPVAQSEVTDSDDSGYSNDSTQVDYADESAVEKQWQFKLEPYLSYRDWRDNQFKFGGDAALHYQKSMQLNITANPDFSFLKPEEETFNTGIEPLIKTEQRDFFRRDSAMIANPLNLINTRNFQKIQQGASFSLKEKSYQSNITYLEDSLYQNSVYGQGSINFGNNLKPSLLGAYGQRSDQKLGSLQADYTFLDQLGIVKYQQAVLAGGDSLKVRQAYFLLAGYGTEDYYLGVDVTRSEKNFLPFTAQYWQSGYDALHGNVYYKRQLPVLFYSLGWDTHLNLQSPNCNPDSTSLTGLTTAFTGYRAKSQFTLGCEINNTRYYGVLYQNRLGYINALFYPSEKFRLDLLIKSGRNYNRNLILTEIDGSYIVNDQLDFYLSYSLLAQNGYGDKYFTASYQLLNLAYAGFDYYLDDFNLGYCCQFSEIKKEVYNDLQLGYNWKELDSRLIYTLTADEYDVYHEIGLKLSYLIGN